MELRRGSITSKIRDMIVRRQILTVPMSSNGISSAIYTITGKKIPANHIIQYLQPFQDEGLVRREITNGKITWYGSWEATPRGSENVPYDLLIHHPRIREATRELFKDEHYAPAIFEACKTLEVMVKEKTGTRLQELGKRRLIGQPLMAEVFKEENPILRINDGSRDEDYDEQAGFKLIFMGIMRGIRDPKGHGQIRQSDSSKTLQYLALTDLLARRIDEATLTQATSPP